MGKLCYNGITISPEVRPMFRNLFNPESSLMITMTWITDCIFLSLFWILGCFPVVTLGASCAALYDSAYRLWRQGEKHPWQRFLHVFRTNWKAGILPSLVYLAAIIAGGKGLIGVWNAAVYGEISWMWFSTAALVAVLALGVLGVLFPMLSRFENSAAGLLKNTVLLALGNVPRTLALGVLNALSGLLTIRFVFPVFFLPALTALLSSLLVEPMFKPYLNE